MSRLGVLYALKEDKLNKLRSLPQDERYDYMLEEIEETLLETPHGYELDKAWEGIQYCLGGGKWNEENSIPTNIVFGGEFLVETEDEIMTLKNHSEVKQIVAYLRQNNLQEIIRKKPECASLNERSEMCAERLQKKSLRQNEKKLQ